MSFFTQRSLRCQNFIRLFLYMYEYEKRTKHMKRYEVEPYLGKAVLIYAKDNAICSGRFYRMRTVNGHEVMEVNCHEENRFLPIGDVLYMIETRRN